MRHQWIVLYWCNKKLIKISREKIGGIFRWLWSECICHWKFISAILDLNSWANCIIWKHLVQHTRLIFCQCPQRQYSLLQASVSWTFVLRSLFVLHFSIKTHTRAHAHVLTHTHINISYTCTNTHTQTCKRKCSSFFLSLSKVKANIRHWPP